MTGTPSRSTRLLAQSSALQRSDNLGSPPALRDIARGNYGISKHFQNSALAALSESSIAISNAFSGQVVEALSDRKLFETLSTAGRNLEALTSITTSPLIESINRSTLSNMALINAAVLKTLPTLRSIDTVSKLVGSQLGTNYSALVSSQFADNINAIVTGMAAPLVSSEALESLRYSFLDSIDPDVIRESIGGLDADPELVDGSSTVGATDPFHQALLGTAGRWATVAAISGKYSYDISIDKLERYLARTAFVALVSVVEFFMTVYGVQGYVLGLLLLGLVPEVTAQERSTLSPEAQRSLNVTCPYCHAVPGMWCIVARGHSLGSKAKNLHRKRYVALVAD